MSDERSPTTSRKPSHTSMIALILLALGGVLLLRSLGALSWGSLELLNRFWPLVAIGFGLDLLGLKTGRSVSFGTLSLGLLGLLVLVGPALGLAGRTTTETFSAPLTNTRSAEVRLDLGAAPTQVSALPGRSDLIRADITGRGRATFSVRGGERKTVRLGERGRFFGMGRDGGRWDVELNPSVPLELGVDGGSGSATLNLSSLELSEFSLDGGSGPAEIALPASAQRYDVTLDGGSGPIRLRLASNAEVDLEFDGGSGPLEVDVGQHVAANLELEGGSGPMTFTLPDDTEARFEVEDDGSGSLTVDPRLTQLEGDGDEGVWETPGFAEAERAVTIRLEDGGSGPVQVR